MNRFRSIISGVTVLMMALVSVQADCRIAKAGGEVSRSQEALRQARAALGGEAKLQAVQSLSVAGKFRRLIQEDQERSGTFELDFLLPDKFIRTETMNMLGAAEVTVITALNGEQVWTDSHSSGPGMVVVRAGADTEQGRAILQRRLQAEYARCLIAWLLLSPPSFPVEFTYAGEAEAEDGRAHVIDVKGANRFAIRLFLDQKSYLPLMMSYRDIPPRMRMMTAAAGREQVDEAVKKARAEAEAEAHGRLAPEPEADIQVFFSDYRNVDGSRLPHHITRSVNGEVNEEWEIQKFQVNPPLKAEKFEKR